MSLVTFGIMSSGGGSYHTLKYGISKFDWYKFRKRFYWANKISLFCTKFVLEDFIEQVSPTALKQACHKIFLCKLNHTALRHTTKIFEQTWKPIRHFVIGEQAATEELARGDVFGCRGCFLDCL